MNKEALEFAKDYTEFVNNIDKAIAEQRRDGRVSHETHREVSDGFAGLYSKLSVMLQTFETMLLMTDIVCKMNGYANMTGNTFDLLTLLQKCLTEQNKKQQ